MFVFSTVPMLRAIANRYATIEIRNSNRTCNKMSCIFTT
jgi:hypothetical protein